MWGTRKHEHIAKVRLTQTDLDNGNVESATNRMNKQDGGLAKHSAGCKHFVLWDDAKIVGREKNATKQKILEG